MVHDWRILPKPFEVGDELTSTLKLKRHVITERYAAVIRDIYHVPKTRKGKWKVKSCEKVDRRSERQRGGGLKPLP